MSGEDNAVVVESAATAEQQAAAEKMGWIPATRYKGEAEKFIDADAYLERGETLLPLVKAHNRRLESEMTALRASASATEQALATAQKAIDQMEERHTVATQRAVDTARKQVKAQLAAASEAGDHLGVAELTDQLTQLNAAEEEEAPAVVKRLAPAPFVPPAELVEWNKDNAWFGKDRRKTSLALGIAQELREAGETATGREFFDLVSEELEKTLPSPPARQDKVEGARNGRDNDTRAGRGGKGYTNLPAEAKTACDADARRFVGADKKYKDAASWRARYAELYFEEK